MTIRCAPTTTAAANRTFRPRNPKSKASASRHAPSAAALRLAQKNRLAELESEAALARDILDEAEERLASAADAIRRQEQRLAEAREKSRISARQLAEAREALAAAERASGDLIRRRDVIAESVSQLQIQLEDLSIQEENARIELEDAPDLTAIDVRLRAQQAEVESYQRAQALVLLQDMVDRINANRKTAGCYAFTPLPVVVYV